jgi:hypothetical protein
MLIILQATSSMRKGGIVNMKPLILLIMAVICILLSIIFLIIGLFPTVFFPDMSPDTIGFYIVSAIAFVMAWGYYSMYKLHC